MKLLKDIPKTEGIESLELERRKAAGECLRCAWPGDRKGSHRVKDCVGPLKLDKGTEKYPKAKDYQKMNVTRLGLNSDDEYSDEGESEVSDTLDSVSDDSVERSYDEHCDEVESEGQYLDE